MSIPDTSLLGTRRLGAPLRLMKTASFLRFFLVDLSRRKAVLLRGGPRRKGLGGIITYTFSSLSPPFPCTLEHPPLILFFPILTAVGGLAVVLLIVER